MMRGCSTGMVFLLTLSLALLLIASLNIGSSGYTLPDLLLGRAPWTILELRAARCLAALATGVILGAAGATLQYMLRNPLADPYLLGVSPAAFLAVTLYALIAPSTASYYLSLTPVAIAGGLAGLGLVALLSRLAFDTNAVILAGIAVSTSLSGASFALEYLASSKLGWNPAYAIFGGFAGVLPSSSLTVLAAALGLMAVLVPVATSLEALLYGDSFALLSGYRPRTVRILALIAVGVTVAVQTGYTGVIGFVGLIAPNAARRILGTVEARKALIASAELGAIITLTADTVSRLAGIVSPYGEIPAGALIALAGGLFLAALATRG